jgi:hypothetical protein
MDSRSSAMAVLLSLAACAGNTLHVGSTQSGSSNSGGVSEDSGVPVAYAGGCTSASCIGEVAACPVGTPSNVQCMPDPNAGAEPAGACALVGECENSGTTTCSIPPPGEDCAASGCSSAGGVGANAGLAWLELDPGNPGRTILDALFVEGGTPTPSTAGSCSYGPSPASFSPDDFAINGIPILSNPGLLTVSGPSLSLSVGPNCNGTYPEVSGPQSFTGGQLISLGWPASSDGAFPAGPVQVPAPHPITLPAGQLLADAAPAMPRASDAPVAWTVAGTPMTLEHVVVLLTQGQTQVACSFDASTGSGVIPADALLQLTTGTATYGVYSEHDGQTSEMEVQFAVRMVAQTATGLAKGTATLE